MAYHSTRVFTQNYKKLCQQCSPTVTQKLLSPVKVRSVVHGGFPVDAFNHKAKLTPWGIKKMFKFTRIMTSWNPGGVNFLSFLENEMDKYLLFTVSGMMHLNPEAYCTNHPKGPIVIDQELDYCGKTSMKLTKQMYFPDYDKPLVTHAIQIVLIDANTRRPTPFPSWWREKYVTPLIQQGKPINLEQIQVPEHSDFAEMDIVIRPSDADPYCHMCSSNFIKVCLEAYQLWHVKEKGFLEAQKAFRDVKLFSQNFKGEAAIGDVLKVKFWPSQTGNNDVFKFVAINDSNSKVVFDTVVEFSSA